MNTAAGIPLICEDKKAQNWKSSPKRLLAACELLVRNDRLCRIDTKKTTAVLIQRVRQLIQVHFPKIGEKFGCFN